MTLTKDQRRLAALAAVLAVAGTLAFWPRTEPVSARPAAPPRRSSGRAAVAPLSPDAVPTLVPIERTEIGRGATERNIFAFAPPTPTRVPTRPPPTPTPVPAQGSHLFIGPLMPPPPPTPTPIVPPAIPYKLMGFFGPLDRPIAAFEDNGRLINAREGDILDGRFIVRKVNKESVDFAFVGLPTDITRRLAVTTDAAR